MKSQDQYIIRAEIPDSLNSFISECKRLPQVYLIFYTPVTNSKLKMLTVVVAKDTHSDVHSCLNSQIHLLDALAQHDTLISVNYHTVVVPVRSEKFMDNYDAMKNDPRVFLESSLIPVTIGVGYNFKLN